MNLSLFFAEKLGSLNCDETTRGYITGIFIDYAKMTNDLSTAGSITVLYAEARNQQSFQKLNNIADWLFFTQSMFPQHLCGASKDYYYSIAQLSYYSCYKLTNKRWLVFERLSDDFPYLTHQVRNIIAHSITS